MKRKVLLLFVMFMCAVGTWAYNYPGNSASDVKDFGDGKTVCFYDDGSDTQQLVVGAGGLAEWFNDATIDKSYLGSTSRTKLVITGTLNADDVAAIKTYFTKFTTVDMEGVTLEEGASVNGMQLPNAEYIALPHGTPIADMKALNSTCPKLKAVAATDAASPTAFTGYSWAAGEIYNICQKGLVDGINSGVCANTMQKLTIGGNVDDRDVSTAASQSSNPNKNWSFAQGANATYAINGVSKTVAADYLAPTHNETACSPWGGTNEISLDFTEAIFSNFGDLAAVSLNVKELLLPTDRNFTVIKPYMFADLAKLEHIIIPNNIVTVGDAAFYVSNNTSKVKEISIGNGVKTIGNAAFKATDREFLEDVRFAAGISDVKILSSVFMGCGSIKHMTLPEGIVSLGESCFEMLVSLESVHFPTTLEYIGKNCFRETGLTLLTIPKSVKVIDYNAFDLCRITDIYLMAETVSQIPYIFATKWDFTNAGTSSTFGGSTLNGNNTTPQISTKNRDTEPIASKDPFDAEELFRLSVDGGNTIARLHYNESIESFINLNPWYVPGQTTQKPSSNALIGTTYNNGGILEAEGLSDTYYFKDKENNTYPAQNGNDLIRAAHSAYYNSNSKAYNTTGENADYSLEDGTSLQTQYYNPETGELIPFTEVTTHMWNVLRKEGWRQFTFRAGDAGSEDIVFNKSYENIWYTMCFPFSLTDEQLETAFNAEYNIADFSGVEIVTEDGDGKPLENKSLVMHFNKVGQAKYYDLNHNEYQRVEGSKQEMTVNRSKFNVYTYTRNGDNYTYVKTYSNKSYAKDGIKENGIVYIDGYLAQAGHPYMIHPNLGTQQGDLPVVAHMVGINYFSKDADVIDQLCKDEARSIDLGTTGGYKGVTMDEVDGSDIAVNTSGAMTENFDQKAYPGYAGQTYTFIGNCNEYNSEVPDAPTIANGGLQAEPNIEDYVDAEYLPNGPVKAEQGPEPSQQDVIDAVGARQTAEDEPQAPTDVTNPADDTTTYPTNFQTLYNAAWQGSTMGELIIANNNPKDLGAQDYWAGGLVMYDGNNPLTAYFGNGTQFQQSDYNALQSLCSQYKSALNDYNSYATLYAQYKADHQAWQDNIDAWAAYDAAYAAWNSFDEAQAEADYQAALTEYRTQLGNYNNALNSVREANAQAMRVWRASVADYAVLIPTNAYFLSRKSNEYYTHFFREIAPMTGREAGHGLWTRYSAVVIPNAAAIAGIEAGVEPEQASGSKAVEMLFDEAYSQYYDATAIEEIVEEAREKGQKVEFLNVVVSIDGKVVRRGDTSLQGLPSGLYIVNGKKYFVK